jgi:soluble lytic murein transglycosylase-like protein
MSTHHASQAFRVGLLLHGSKIWISEFLSIIIVSTSLVTLFGLTFFILLDEAIIRANDRTISALKNDSLAQSKSLSELSQKVIIADALKSFRGGTLPLPTCALLADIVCNNSATYGYDPFLLLAVINVESMFSSSAMGQYKNGDASGAFGLMQIKLETAQDIARNLGMRVTTIHDLFKPEVNLALGVGYLTRLIAQFHSFKLGLLAYNQGPAVIQDYLSSKTPLPISYYNRVLKSYYQLKKSVAMRAGTSANQ